MENDHTISAMMRNLIKRLNLVTVALILLCFFFGPDFVVGIQYCQMTYPEHFCDLLLWPAGGSCDLHYVDYRVGHR